MTERVHRVVAQARDFAAAPLFDRERLEHVVHFIRFEVEPRRFAGVQAAPTLEESHPVLIEDNLFDWKFSGKGQGSA